MNLGEAAARLGISVRTARRWIHAGLLTAELEPGRYGPQYRVPIVAVQSLQTERVASRPATVETAGDAGARPVLRQEMTRAWQELTQIQQELWQTCQELAAARSEMQHLRRELAATRQAIATGRTGVDGQELEAARVS